MPRPRRPWADAAVRLVASIHTRSLVPASDVNWLARPSAQAAPWWQPESCWDGVTPKARAEPPGLFRADSAEVAVGANRGDDWSGHRMGGSAALCVSGFASGHHFAGSKRAYMVPSSTHLASWRLARTSPPLHSPPCIRRPRISMRRALVAPPVPLTALGLRKVLVVGHGSDRTTDPFSGPCLPGLRRTPAARWTTLTPIVARLRAAGVQKLAVDADAGHGDLLE